VIRRNPVIRRPPRRLDSVEHGLVQAGQEEELDADVPELLGGGAARTPPRLGRAVAVGEGDGEEI